MKDSKRGTVAPAPTFPIAQVSVADLIDRMRGEDIEQLLTDQLSEALARYQDAWAAVQQRFRAPDAYKLKEAERLFRGAREHDHPMYNGRWATANGGGGHVQAQLERALKSRDWQEVIVLGGMMCVRDMLYGRAVEAAPAAKAKAVKKTAKKKPAAKKPATVKRSTPAARPTKAGNGSELDALIIQAAPFFKADPDLDREGLIKKMGSRRYERLTTFKALRAAALAEPDATKKRKPAKPVGERPGINPAQAWPFATGSTPPGGSASAPKPKRPRRDPTKPVVLPESSIPKGVRTKPWPSPDTDGNYNPADAEHEIEFKAGDVVARFCAIETENGWTTGCDVQVQLGGDLAAVNLVGPLNDHGPIALDADTAIRDVVGDMLAEVKRHLKAAEKPTSPHDEALAARVTDLEKLRTWLLGFQARGSEKVSFLKKGGHLDLAV